MSNKNKLGVTGINLVVYAVIGLIIITVVAFMLGNKIRDFSKGKEQAPTCSGACSAAGAKYSAPISKKSCDFVGGKAMGGTFYDVENYDEPCFDEDGSGCAPSTEPRVCCCYG